MTETLLPTQRRDWAGAFRNMRKLLNDPNDTHSVFRIMAALNAGNAGRSYQRLLRSAEGGSIAYKRPEMIEKLMDRAWLTTFAPGTVGAAYRGFLEKTGYSADGLKAVGDDIHGERRIDHPYAWFGRRERDLHDI